MDEAILASDDSDNDDRKKARKQEHNQQYSLLCAQEIKNTQQLIEKGSLNKDTPLFLQLTKRLHELTIALAIIGIVVIYGIAVAMHGGMFTPKTASRRKLDKIEKDVASIAKKFTRDS